MNDDLEDKASVMDYWWLYLLCFFTALIAAAMPGILVLLFGLP